MRPIVKVPPSAALGGVRMSNRLQAGSYLQAGLRVPDSAVAPDGRPTFLCPDNRPAVGSTVEKFWSREPIARGGTGKGLRSLPSGCRTVCTRRGFVGGEPTAPDRRRVPCGPTGVGGGNQRPRSGGDSDALRAGVWNDSGRIGRVTGHKKTAGIGRRRRAPVWPIPAAWAGRTPRGRRP